MTLPMQMQGAPSDVSADNPAGSPGRLPGQACCTRAEALTMAAGVAGALGAAGALLAGGAFAPAVARAQEGAGSSTAPLGDAGAAGLSSSSDSAGASASLAGTEFNPYAGVEEKSTSFGAGAGAADYIPPYATPHVTYADERLAGVRRVLVVVDYQVDFVDGGVFGRIEPAVAIEDALCAKIEEYRDRGDIIIYTMDTHPADEYDDTREASVNPLHCDPATEGWQLYGRVRDLLTPQSAILIKKGTYGSPELVRTIERLRDQGLQIEGVEFAGVSTTCRVLHNAIMVYNAFPELPMIMDEATTASYTDERTAEQLEELEAWGFIVKRTA